MITIMIQMNKQSESAYEPFVWGKPDYVKKYGKTMWKMHALPKNKHTNKIAIL